MGALNDRLASECRFDEVSLGEVMLRFDPGEGRIRTARSFNVWEGGGEYNVARGLAKCFGLRTAVVTGLVRNELGRLLEDLIMQGGVDLTRAKWFDYDGIGGGARIGLNFTERGFGVRGALGVSDRARSAASLLAPGDIDWKGLFGTVGARWFHTGGIYAALSKTTPGVIAEAIRAARACGTVVSYDLNYRPSLWKDAGGPERASAVNREIASTVDVLFGNEEDFTAALGLEVPGLDGDFSRPERADYRGMIRALVGRYPNVKAAAVTLRTVKSASRNDWGALLWCNGEFFKARPRENLEVLDRVGGGDGFASGVIYGFLAGRPPADCLELGAAHGALAMTTPGDCSMASLEEVERLAAGGGARVER